jgi:hypothetical protein
MAGIEAAQASTAQSLLSSTFAPNSSTEAKHLSREELIDQVEQNYSKKRVGEGNVKMDEERLAQAMNEEKKRKFRADGDNDNMGKKRKNVQPGGSHDVTEEELGEFLVSVVGSFADIISRGIPNEPSNDRRPNGELHRRREMKALLFLSTLCIYFLLHCSIIVDFKFHPC